MRVLLDGTPLLGRRTGIGRYTASLLAALASRSDVDVSVMGLTTRGWRSLPELLPRGVRATGPPLPARALRACWSRSAFPPVEILAGRFDVVHGTNFVLPPSVRARGVVTVHDLAFLDAPGELSERDLPDLVGRSVRRATQVCTPTAAVAESVREGFGVARSKVRVTPLGIDLEWFRAAPPGPRLRHRLGLPGEYLLFVGADGPRKGLDTLLRAHHPGLAPLVVAGPGRSGSDGRVVATGYLADDDLRRVVAGARALVLPSRDEGFGLPLLEAMATGAPVVCSDIAALREVTGGHAVTAPHGDAEALRGALTRALELPRGAQADAPRRDHASRFTWQACAEATVSAYRRASEPR